ncbi:MAG: hypothetical protein AAGG51_30850 [Cyanobacteria bacterium P01_G01_bin.54]
MTWLSILFILGLPIASLFFRIGVGLTGGHSIPLVCAFSYYMALCFEYISVFALTRISRFFALVRIKKVQVTLFFAFISLSLGLIIGSALAQAGILEPAFNDSSRGDVPFEDVFFCAFLGTLSGFGLGFSNNQLMRVLTSGRVNYGLSLIICLLASVLSIAVALSTALDLVDWLFWV